MNENLRIEFQQLLNMIEQLKEKDKTLNVEYEKMLYQEVQLWLVVDNAEYNNKVSELEKATKEYEEYKEKLEKEYRKICDIEKKVTQLNTVMKEKLRAKIKDQCSHPLYYNIGFFKGNNPIRKVSKEEANYRVFICLECGREFRIYRGNAKKNDCHWYNKLWTYSYGINTVQVEEKKDDDFIEYEDGNCFDKVQIVYFKECGDKPENEVVLVMKKKY